MPEELWFVICYYIPETRGVKDVNVHRCHPVKKWGFVNLTPLRISEDHVTQNAC